MIENVPSLFAVVVPKEEESLNRVTVEPASAVPEIVGVESLVKDEETINGTSGAVESIVIERPEEAEEILPAASVAVAVNE